MTKNTRRMGSITKEQALKRFHEYYDNRHSNPKTALKAKMFDIMYQKKPKFTLRPGEPGSERYLLKEGPRTFDMVGVDSFDEGEEVELDSGNYPTKKIVSKGATFRDQYAPNEPESDSEPDESGRQRSTKIYGPRVGDKKLYSKYFKDEYEKRRTIPDHVKGSLKSKHLVERRWELYRQELEEQEEIIRYFRYQNNDYSIDKDLVIYDSNDEEIYQYGVNIDEELMDYLLENKIIIQSVEDEDVILLVSEWVIYSDPDEAFPTVKVYNNSIVQYEGGPRDGENFMDDGNIEGFLEYIESQGIDTDVLDDYRVDEWSYVSELRRGSPASTASSSGSSPPSPRSPHESSPPSTASSSGSSRPSTASSSGSSPPSPRSPPGKSGELRRDQLRKQHCFDCQEKDPQCLSSECSKCDYCDKLKVKSFNAMCVDCKARNVDCDDPQCAQCNYCKILKQIKKGDFKVNLPPKSLSSSLEEKVIKKANQELLDKRDCQDCIKNKLPCSDEGKPNKCSKCPHCQQLVSIPQKPKTPEISQEEIDSEASKALDALELAMAGLEDSSPESGDESETSSIEGSPESEDESETSSIEGSPESEDESGGEGVVSPTQSEGEVEVSRVNYVPLSQDEKDTIKSRLSRSRSNVSVKIDEILDLL